MQDQLHKIELKAEERPQRFDVINGLIKSMGYKRYLEIGVQNGECFKRIECEYKVGVDPSEYSKATIFQTSNQFFNDNIEMFDIIFLDGLHEKEQVLMDIQNSLKFLKANGTVVLHDCNPESVEAQTVPRMNKVWNGDVWKAWVTLRRREPFLDMCVLNMDHGIGLLKPGKQNLIDYTEESERALHTKVDYFDLNDDATEKGWEEFNKECYEALDRNRKEWLNLTTEITLKYDTYESGSSNIDH